MVLRYQAKSLRTLARTKREAAGLGANFFYNNSNESINKLLKDSLTRKSLLKDIVRKWEKIVEQQKSNCERAVVSQGLYRFKAKYNNLTHSPDKFHRLSSENRKKVVENVCRQSEVGYDQVVNASCVSKSSTRQTLTGSATINCARKRLGRKINERPRNRKKITAASLFCTDVYKPNTNVFFRYLDTTKARKCYACDASFSKENIELLGVVMTYRKYRDPVTGVLTVSKKAQKVYCHLRCLDRRDDFKKPYHICNYLNTVISNGDNAVIQRCGNID